ncbi:MAG TPA: dethiobiotin synthase [Mizugakiibacter sp.]
MTARGVFIAGTDTGIGKTYASCALLHALRGAGLDAVGMKPVASGCEETPQGLRNADALALQAASAPPTPAYAQVNPVALAEAVSPHLAARAAGIEITLPPLRAAYAALAAERDIVVVEGVGGWLAPLSDTLPASTLATGLGLPVILVVGLRLGCLNHALLSARAIIADGCRLLGWIGNTIDPAMARLDDNLDTLRRLLPAPCLGVLDHASDGAAAAPAAALARAVAALRTAGA